MTSTKPTPAKSKHPAAQGSSRTPFRRILLKLSGESFCKPGGFGVDPEELESIAREVFDAAQVGAQLAIVVGGGNIIRGAELAAAGHIHQATADYMGMLGTVINGLALKEKLHDMGMDCRVMTAIDIRAVAEPFIRGRALRHLDKGRVVILVAGTGNPFFTTDTCASLRAVELECEVLMKATKVDGVYTADPRKDPTATRYDTLTFQEALTKGLRIMDTAALAMCMEKNVPILVFDFKRSGNIRRVVQGEPIGTLVRRDPSPATV
ncbi:MAG: uridylate kinase [Phycisphaerae bacterium]|nr:Uridylate kinase [Phycisphaerales bacterium]MCK6475465.1 UMP kinase [Phycisphaerales bacterium]